MQIKPVVVKVSFSSEKNRTVYVSKEVKLPNFLQKDLGLLDHQKVNFIYFATKITVSKFPSTDLFQF